MQIDGDNLESQFARLKRIIERMERGLEATSGAPAAPPPPPSNHSDPRLDRIEEQIIATGGLVVEALGILLARKKDRCNERRS
jgi:hypothetical protein